MKYKLPDISQHTGLIVLLVTAAAYCSAYFFETGYLDAFDIDEMFATVDLTSLIASILFICIGSAAVYSIYSTLNDIKRHFPENIFWPAVMTAIAAIIALLLKGSQLQPEAWILAGFFALVLAVNGLHMSWRKLAKKPPTKAPLSTPFSTYRSRNTLFYVVFGGAVVCTMFAYMLGFFFGSKANTFPVLAEDRGHYSLVVRNYGDRMYVKTYDKSRHVFTRQTQILPTDKPITILKSVDISR